MAKRFRKSPQSGEVFKELLKAKEFSAYKLAQATGLDKSSISNIANGFTASPKPETLQKIANALNVELGELTRIFTENYHLSQQPEINTQAQELATQEKVFNNPTFVGREDDIKQLKNLVDEGAKVIGIYAKGGVGKTTLAKELFKELNLEPLEIRIGIDSDNITPVETWLKYWLKEDLKGEINVYFGILLQKLKAKLKAQRVGILIDNLEPALDGNGKFIEAHCRYIELLRVLAEPDVQSITIITSRERLNESKVQVEAYKLPSLNETAWREFFNYYNIDSNSPTFNEMYKAYGGNAKAMKILCGAIKDELFEGDLEAYWRENKVDLLIERDLEELVASQFERLHTTDSDAYKLLCRMGVYRYQDFPKVSITALNCLLWDVEEERHKRVVKSLQNRFLIESEKDVFGEIQYWLHPVIREEAIRRLKPKKAEWRRCNGEAGNYLCILFSPNYPIIIPKLVTTHVADSVEEQMYLNIDNSAKAVYKGLLSSQEKLALEVTYHALEFYGLDSFAELTHEPKFSNNLFSKAIKNMVYEYIDSYIDIGFVLYNYGLVLHVMAVCSEQPMNYNVIEKNFEYSYKSFQVSQRFFNDALSIANKVKENTLVFEIYTKLALSYYYKSISLYHKVIYLCNMLGYQEIEFVPTLKESKASLNKAIKIFNELKEYQLENKLKKVINSLELSKVKQVINNLELSPECSEFILTKIVSVSTTLEEK